MSHPPDYNEKDGPNLTWVAPLGPAPENVAFYPNSDGVPQIMIFAGGIFAEPQSSTLGTYNEFDAGGLEVAYGMYFSNLSVASGSNPCGSH